MTDSGNRWSEFVAFCQALRAEQEVGRQSLRRDWKFLRELFDSQVRPSVTQADIERLLGKCASELDPEENDLKAMIAYAAGRGTLKPENLREALRADNSDAPLSFLTGLSGKTFGERIAPQICKFWLAHAADSWSKRRPSELYDVEWRPQGYKRALRIEIKASSEYREYRFQQVRSPRAGQSLVDAYDALLCLGVTARTIEFWLVPAPIVVDCIDQRLFTPQHGGRKKGLASNTYWVTMTTEARTQLQDYAVTPHALRERGLALLQQLGRHNQH